MVAAGREGSTDAGGGSSTMWTCPGPPGRSVALQVITGPRYFDYAFCNSESTTYRFEVETAAGSKSTLEYKIKVDEPGGYFGCG